MLIVYASAVLCLYMYWSRGLGLMLEAWCGRAVGGYSACGIVEVISRGRRPASVDVVSVVLLAAWASLPLPLWRLSRLRGRLCMPGAVVLASGPAKGVRYARGFDPYCRSRLAVRARRARTARGARRGASERRYQATGSDIGRLKLLVEPHPAILCLKRNLYGMQEVRGSNPLSSTTRSSRFRGDHVHVWALDDLRIRV